MLQLADEEVIIGAGVWRESDADVFRECRGAVWTEAKRLLDHRIIDRVSGTCERFVVAFEREKILEEVLGGERRDDEGPKRRAKEGSLPKWRGCGQ